MIIYILGMVAIGMISVLLSFASIVFPFFGLFTSVDVLPFGADDVVVSFVGYVHGLIQVLPFMAIVWNLLLVYWIVAIVLFVIDFIAQKAFGR